MKLREKTPALILIDIQKGFLDEDYWGGNRNNKNAEQISGIILERFRELNLPIFHIRHSSENLNSKLHNTNVGFEFNDFVLPKSNEPIITKNVNSAFIGTNLEQYLRDNKIDEIVIAGLTLPHCVSTTTRMAGNLGFKVILIEDATASFELKDSRGNTLNPEEIHKYHIAALNEEFAKVMTTEEYIVKKV